MATNDPSVELLTSAARMYYLDGLEQRSIAELLGVSRSTVSRLLTAARERGIVRVTVAPYDPRDANLERRLSDRFGLKQAIVVRTLGRSSESVRRSVGYYAAPAVSSLFVPAMTIGVAGGRTVGCLVDAVKAREALLGSTVVQLMGHIDPTASRMDAPELARTLAQRLGASCVTLNAPVFADDGASRDVFLAHGQIGATFRRFSGLGLALVGIGSLLESVFFARGVLDATDRARLRAAGAVGEICGRFFDRGGQECRTEYRDRVIGVDLDLLRRCGNAIGVTNGADRAPAVAAALAGGLVTGLAVDHRCAEAILTLTGSA